MFGVAAHILSLSHLVSARTLQPLLCAHGPPSVHTQNRPLPRVLPLVLCFSGGKKGEEMGAGLGSCFQWIFGENPDQRKAPLTVEMEDGPMGREVASLLQDRKSVV